MRIKMKNLSVLSSITLALFAFTQAAHGAHEPSSLKSKHHEVKALTSPNKRVGNHTNNKTNIEAEKSAAWLKKCSALGKNVERIKIQDKAKSMKYDCQDLSGKDKSINPAGRSGSISLQATELSSAQSQDRGIRAARWAHSICGNACRLCRR